MSLDSTNFPEHNENEFMKRGYLLPEGLKDLTDTAKYKESPVVALKKWTKPVMMLKARAKPVTMPEAWATALQVQSHEKLKSWTRAQVLPALNKALKANDPKLPMIGAVSTWTSISQLAVVIDQKPAQIVADLLKLGIFICPNEVLDFEIISKIANLYGYLAEIAIE